MADPGRCGRKDVRDYRDSVRAAIRTWWADRLVREVDLSRVPCEWAGATTADAARLLVYGELFKHSDEIL